MISGVSSNFLMWSTPQLSARRLHSASISTEGLRRKTSCPWPWQPGRAGFTHHPEHCSFTIQKRRKKNIPTANILFFFHILLLAHVLTSNVSLVQKRMWTTGVFAGWPAWQGVPTMIYCLLVTCGEDRFPMCTVKAPLSCRAVGLHTADLFNQKHQSRTRGQEVRIHWLALSCPFHECSSHRSTQHCHVGLHS